MTWPFGGLPIGGVFLGQADGPVLGVARLGGPLALTAAVYVGWGGVGALGEAGSVPSGTAPGPGPSPGEPEAHGAARRVRADPESPEPTGARFAHLVSDATAGLGPWLAIGVVIVALVVGGCRWRPTTPPTAARRWGRCRPPRSRAAGPRGFRKSQVDPSMVLAAQMAATDAAGTTGPRSIARSWCCGPRTWCPWTPCSTTRRRRRCCPGWPATLGTTLVVGVTETVSPTTFRNEVVAFGPDGTLVSRFEKVHRVPFGEYVPYRGFFAHLGNLSAVPRDAIPGHRDRPAAHAGRAARAP